jgi:hypothetical protein
MTIVMQGMRRSGTTIVYDALDQDPDLTLWYEPLAAAKAPAIGGGSGAREVDVFERLRAARTSFLQDRQGVDVEVLNHGAPRDAALEFGPELPPVVADYLRFLLDRPGAVAGKFTRLYSKIPAMHGIVPNAGFVQLVRDPQAVVVSYLFGKGRRNERIYGDPDVFFTRRSSYTAWSSHPISELVRREYADEGLPEPTDLERILLIWRFTVERAWRDARATFGDRAIMVRHEDFCADPERELRRIHDLDGRAVPESVADWARANVRTPGPIHAEGDPRWRESFRRMGLDDLLDEAGYGASIKS